MWHFICDVGFATMMHIATIRYKREIGMMGYLKAHMHYFFTCFCRCGSSNKHVIFTADIFSGEEEGIVSRNADPHIFVAPQAKVFFNFLHVSEQPNTSNTKFYLKYHN